MLSVFYPPVFPVYIDSLDHFLNVVECMSKDEFIHWIKFMSIAMGAVVQFILINRILAHVMYGSETNLSTLKKAWKVCVPTAVWQSSMKNNNFDKLLLSWKEIDCTVDYAHAITW